MKPAIASLFALGTTFCLMGTKTRHEVPTFGTRRNHVYAALSGVAGNSLAFIDVLTGVTGSRRSRVYARLAGGAGPLC